METRIALIGIIVENPIRLSSLIICCMSTAASLLGAWVSHTRKRT